MNLPSKPADEINIELSKRKLQKCIEDSHSQIMDKQLIYLDHLSLIFKHKNSILPLLKEKTIHNPILMRQKSKFLDLVELLDFPIKLAAKKAKISESSGYRILKQKLKMGRVLNTNKKRIPNSFILNEAHFEYISSIIQDQREVLSVPQIQRKFEENFNYLINRSTLYFYIRKKMGFTYKKIG